MVVRMPLEVATRVRFLLTSFLVHFAHFSGMGVLGFSVLGVDEKSIFRSKNGVPLTSSQKNGKTPNIHQFLRRPAIARRRPMVAPG